MNKVKHLARVVYKLCAYLFWPQRRNNGYGQRKLEETDSRLD